MKKIPVYPKYEENDYNSDDTNLHADFSQFLNEAKHYKEKNSEFRSQPQSQVDSPKTKQDRDKNNNKKKKKTWKSFISPWWKGEKKSDNNNKARIGSAESSRASNMRRGFISGPISSGGEADLGRPRGLFSGPIMSSLFSPIRKVDSEVAYMCVDQFGRPCVDKNYGPVYLVT